MEEEGPTLPDDALLWDMVTLQRQLGNVSRDTVERLFAAGAFRRIKLTKGGKTFALSSDVRAYVERLAAGAVNSKK